MSSDYDEWRVQVDLEKQSGAESWDASINEDGVLFENTAPTVSNLSPEDGDVYTDNTDVELSADISDPDYGTAQGENVTATFYDASDDSVIGTENLSSNGTASTTWSDATIGANDWYVVAEDEYGGETTTETYQFETPSELEIRDELNTSELVTTESNVEVTFFASDEVVTKTTSDGIVSLEGLPNEEMVIQVDADGYITRQAVLRSITEQQTVYVLPENASTVTTRFTLSDPTGQYDQRNTRVYVQKPIRVDGETVYETVVADTLGSSGYSTVLHRDQRYRLEIENLETGQTQTLGPYVATASEEVVLEVDQLNYEFDDTDIGYQWGAEYRNETDPSVQFGFQAPDIEAGGGTTDRIQELSVTVRQRGGNETVILDETFTDVSTIQETAVIPEDIDDPEAQTWVVEWNATLVFEGEGGVTTDEISGSTVVGPDQLPVDMPGVPDNVKHIASVFLILLVGGLFSSVNAEIGGVVVSFVAGMLWFIGFLPSAISGMLIALALLVSILFLVNRSRGGIQ